MAPAGAWAARLVDRSIDSYRTVHDRAKAGVGMARACPCSRGFFLRPPGSARGWAGEIGGTGEGGTLLCVYVELFL